MSYSNYQLNQRINNLQNQINNLDPVGSDTLNDILTNGNESTLSIELSETLSAQTLLLDGTIAKIEQKSLGVDRNANMNSIGFNTVDKITGYNTTLSNTTLSFGGGDYQTYITHTDTSLNITNDNEMNIEAPTVNMNGQVNFDTPPHSVSPILGNDLTTKSYVDTLIGNYGGNGLPLYLNPNGSQPFPIITPITDGILSQSLQQATNTPPSSFYRLETTALGTDQLIATFTCPVGFPNVSIIPTGLWSMLIYGYASGAGGQLYYHFHLYEVDSTGTTIINEIGTGSGFSSDVNAISSSDPDAYHPTLSIVPQHNMASLDSRLQIKIYSTGTGMGGGVKLNTLFNGPYYSFITTSLSGGVSLLTQNNNWTGENVWNSLVSVFETDLYAPTQPTGTANNLVATCELVNNKLLDYTDNTLINYANLLTTNTFQEKQSFNLGISSQSLETTSIDAVTPITSLTIGEIGTSLTLKGGSTNSIAVDNLVNMTVKDQTALSNNNNVANTKYVDTAISALSLVYQTIAGMSGYLTDAVASATYATIASLSNYGAKASLNTWDLLQTFTSGISSQSIVAPTIANPVSLYTTNTGAITIGSGATTTGIGNYTFLANDINHISPTNAIVIGLSQTNGALNLGTNPARTGNINIGANSMSVKFGGWIWFNYSTLPTLNQYCGARVQLATASNITIPTTVGNIMTFNLPFGSWIVEYSCSTTANVGYSMVSISTTTGTHAVNRCSAITTSASGTILGQHLITTTIPQSSSTAVTFFVVGSCVGAQTASNQVINYTRIG